MINLLRELALDLGIVWKRLSDHLWREIDPDVWLITRNPVADAAASLRTDALLDDL
jgi:hypothetical protein